VKTIKENKTNINKKEEPTLEPKCGTEMPKHQSCQRKNQDLRGKKSWLERKERKGNETKKKKRKKKRTFKPKSQNAKGLGPKKKRN
jgi:hypothetical protein